MSENQLDPKHLIALLKIDEIDAIAKKLTGTVINRFKQELQGENEDLLERQILQYRAKVSRRTWHVAQKWCKWNDEGPVLMPDNTRMYYRKGATEVIVQEFPPQMRMMKFVGSLRRSNTSEEITADEEKKVYTYSLALPFIIFIYKFVNGMLSEVYVSFCDRPLKRLTERPMKPYLCNIDSTMKLCLQKLESQLLEKDNLVQQVALVLNHFWSSVYNEDWSGNYWEYRSSFAKTDPRIKDLDSWQEASLDNPLFVIDDVKWLPHDHQEYGDLLVKLFESDNENHKFQEDLYEDLSGEFVNAVKSIFEENTKSVESRVKAISTDDIARELLDVLKTLQNNSKEGTS